MAITEFFDTFNSEHITGVIDTPVITDSDGTPNRVLERDSNNTVDITWRLTSDDPVLNPVNAYAGQWVIRLSFESFGPENEFSLDEVTVDFDDATSSAPDSCEWTQQFTIPANSADEGVYKMVALITYRFPNDSRGAMAGFHEGPMLTFYQD